MNIKKAGVIGAGTMGGGIAALLAGAGIPVVLLDIPATDGKDRNAIVKSLWDRQLKASPAALYSPDVAQMVKLGNTEDNLNELSDCDWIVEVIIEQLEPKQQLMARLEAIRKPDSIISSNTSGIPIGQICAGRSEDFRKHFLGTHFFNPPRYLKLLEVIPTPDTDPAVISFIKDIGARVLGKGVVVCKDRPGFIANRIGMYVAQARINYALQNGYSVEEVDTLTGPVIGNPKTATFRLADLVGLDVQYHVTRNQYNALTDDEERAIFSIPPILQKLVDAKALGNKSGQGFYKKTKSASGSTEFWVINMQSDEYAAPTNPDFALMLATKGADLGTRMRTIFDKFADERGGKYIVETTLPILAYTARRVPEIADSIHEIDNAMRWGFNTEAGTFEMWDMIGVRRGVEMMKARNIAVASWVEDMLARGVESFYQMQNGVAVGVYDPNSGKYAKIERNTLNFIVKEHVGTPRELKRNASAALFDMGDGVLLYEFHSKGNTLDDKMMEIGRAGLDLLERDEWRGMVIGSQQKDFCLGANIGIFLASMAGGPAKLQEAAATLQNFLMDFRFARKPVVSAPYQRVLGGGAEVSMSTARTVAAAETYMGLVEVGVGIIPAGGGCKEMVRRNVSPHISEGVDGFPFLKNVFETIAFAKVSESAFIARQRGFLAPSDQIVLNADWQLGYAKQTVIDLADAGYVAPQRSAKSVYAMGARGKAILNNAIDGYRWGKMISNHDALIARKLAHILCGGDLTSPQWVTEDYILELEREAFASLLGETKTQERIAYMIKNGKPLRN